MTIEPGEGTPMSSAQPPADPSASSASGESTSELLQSMVSRAVEGQVGEQRELTNAVTLEVREAVRFLSERLDGVTRMVGQRGEELADIRTALTAIDAHVRSQAETIGVLSSGLQALPSYGERVSILQDNLQVLHRQLVGIEESIGSSDQDEKLGGLLAAIESAITPLDHRLNEISDLGTAQSALLSQLQSSSSQLQQTVAGVHERIEPLASDVAAIGGNVSGLVEGSGAASTDDLDARISESVAAAVGDTEQRLMAHVDEAVVALAQMLLKRRTPTTAGQITGTPIGDVPTGDVPIAEPAAPIDEPESAAPATEWWERDIAAAPPSEAVEADEVDTEGSESADEVDLDEDGPADADEPDEPDDEAPSALPSEADDAGRSSPYPQLPPPLAGTAVEPPAAPAWRPQTPLERNPADPTVTLEDGKKKRRWRRNK